MWVSGIVLNWNGGVENCTDAVESLLSQNWPHTEVIFVDNGSTDGSREAVAARYPQIQVVALGENLGVSRGRNAGARAARGDLLFFLDNDGSLADKDTLSAGVELFTSTPDLGAAYISVTGSDWDRVDPPLDGHGRVDGSPRLASSFRGGAAFIRRDLFLAVGGYPDDYFRQGEERYVSLLVYDRGFKVAYWPRYRMRHKGSDYPGKARAVNLWACLNELKTVSRLYPSPEWLFVLAGKVVAWVWRFAYRRDMGSLKATAGELPGIVRERKRHRHVSRRTARLVEAIMFGELAREDARNGSVSALADRAEEFPMFKARLLRKLKMHC